MLMVMRASSLLETELGAESSQHERFPDACSAAWRTVDSESFLTFLFAKIAVQLLR
jgi:hypothetical protein